MFQFLEKPGPYAVGLKVVELCDVSRKCPYPVQLASEPAVKDRGRLIQALLWYPSERGPDSPIKVGDYVSLLESGPAHDTLSADQWRSDMGAMLTSSMWAACGAASLPGGFPTVVYAPGFSGVSWENADLCEFLASHGYLVVASSSLGASTPNMTYDLEGLDTQARDISFLIDSVKTLSILNERRVAVVGFSWGGLANIFAAARDPRISALVSLDGSLRFSPGFLRQAGDIHPEQMTVPLLSIAQGQLTLEDWERLTQTTEREGPNILNRWTHADVLSLYMLGMAHGEFGSMYQRNETTWREVFHEWHLRRGGYTREHVLSGYAWMARYVLTFLDAYLKYDTAAKAFLSRTPAENGVPPHMIAAQFRPANCAVAGNGCATGDGAVRASLNRP